MLYRIFCLGFCFFITQFNLQMPVHVLLEWYDSNCMRTNPDKYQCIVFEKEYDLNESIAITDI